MNEHSPEELQRIDRRRRRVWRRAWGLVGLAALALMASRLWWGHAANRRLQAVIDRYHAAGEPILPEDFVPPKPLKDEENAAALYEQAAIAITIPPGMEVKGEAFVADPRFAWAYREDSRKFVEANQPVLAFLGQADALNDCDWGARFSSPMINVLLPSLSSVRNLQKTLAALAAAQHVTGDDAGAVLTWSHMHKINLRLLAPRENPLIQHLVALGCAGALCRSVEAVTPTLEVGDATTGASFAGPAPPEQVRSLIALLLDDAPWQEGWWNAATAERASALDILGLRMNGNVMTTGAAGGSLLTVIPYKVGAAVLGPLAVSDATFGLEALTKLRDAGTRPSYADACAIVSDSPAARGTSDPDATWLARLNRSSTEILLPSVQRAMTLQYRGMADRRLTATALAIRLFELDHGRRPATLAELVPDYLPAIPDDPFDQPGRPIRYLPAASPPILYSINVNGVDDGGTWEMQATNRARIHADRLDYPFFLDANRPSAPLDLENGLVNPPTPAR